MKNVSLEDNEWGWVISTLATALAYQNPTFAKMSGQLATQRTQLSGHPGSEAEKHAKEQIEREREHQKTSSRGLSPQTGNSGRVERGEES